MDEYPPRPVPPQAKTEAEKKAWPYVYDKKYYLINPPGSYDTRFTLASMGTKTVMWPTLVLMGTLHRMAGVFSGGGEIKAPYQYTNVSYDIGDVDATKPNHTQYFNSMQRSDQRQWKDGSRGLVVMIPGVYAEPYMWKDYCDKIIEQNPDLDIYTPMLEHGRMTAEQLAHSLIPEIENYVMTTKIKNVVIIGFSYGALVGGFLAGTLRVRHPAIRVLFAGIAGIFFGTSMVDLAATFRLSGFFVDPVVYRDIQFASDSGRECIAGMLDPVVANHVYHFYASTDDEKIRPFTSSLPNTPNAFHHVASGVSHSGMLDEARADVVERVTKFYQNFH